MRIRYQIGKLLFDAVTFLPANMPLPATRAFGSALGDMAWQLDSRHRRRADRTLETALPEMSRDDREKTIRRCFRHFGSVSAELFHLGNSSPVDICSRLHLEHWHRFAEAEAHGRGVLILTAHLGLHELLAPVIALYKGPMCGVARPLRNRVLNDRLDALRGRFGNRAIPKRGAVLGLFKAIADQQRALILIDQRVHPTQGIQVPFFGIPSWCSPFPAHISLRTSVPVLPIFAFQKPGGRYRLVVRPPIYADGASGVAELTSRYMAVTEDEIRSQPEQWLWMHDRWKRH